MKKEYSCGAVLYTWLEAEPYYVLVRDTGWSMPKGHVEKGESDEQTALREIKEETGVEAELNAHFRTTVSYVPRENPGVEKQETYFLASYQDQPLKPLDEYIEDIKLLRIDAALELLPQPQRDVLLDAHESVLDWG